MKIYLLIENKTNKVVSAYRYVDVALINKDKGIKKGIMNVWDRNKPSEYRIEVMEVIE